MGTLGGPTHVVSAADSTGGRCQSQGEVVFISFVWASTSTFEVLLRAGQDFCSTFRHVDGPIRSVLVWAG